MEVGHILRVIGKWLVSILLAATIIIGVVVIAVVTFVIATGVSIQFLDWWNGNNFLSL